MGVACGSSEYWLMAAICPGSAIRINTASTQGLSETMRCGLAAAATDCGNTQRIDKARNLKNRIRTPLNNNMGPLRDWLGSFLPCDSNSVVIRGIPQSSDQRRAELQTQ